MTRKAPASLAALTALTLAGCATPAWRPSTADLLAEATPLCTVLTDPKSYVGKRMLVRGYVSLAPHNRVFWDKGCERGFIPVRPRPETPRSRDRREFLDASIDPSGGWDELDDGRWRIGYGRGLALSSLSIRSIDPEGAEHFIHPWGPQMVRVVYSGILTDHAGTLICDYACSELTLEEAELLVVRP